ncbi:hypothetical protein [Nostoc sp.]|uniref:hypothetical protein n=1 Tax=Nostoc sp. TaxID=1180 RepID=UPI002FF8DFAF
MRNQGYSFNARSGSNGMSQAIAYRGMMYSCSKLFVHRKSLLVHEILSLDEEANVTTTTVTPRVLLHFAVSI